MERRTAIILMTGAAAEATLVACGPSRDLLSEWKKMPARQRLVNLETKNYPKSEKFNTDSELVTAVAEDYTSNIRSNKSSAELAKLVHFVDTQTIAQVIADDNNRPLSDNDTKIYSNRLEITSEKTGDVYMNSQLLASVTAKIRATQPQLVEMYNGRDVLTILKKSVLYHAFSHVNQTSEHLAIPAITFNGTTEPMTFDGYDATQFTGKGPSGDLYYLAGPSEAQTEYLGQAIGQKTGTYLNTQDYADLGSFIDRLNKAANIPLADYADYYMGRKPQKELLERWSKIKDPANPDYLVGLSLMMAIALYHLNPVENNAVRTNQLMDRILTR